MKIVERLAGRNWFVEAENGDRQDVVRGREYTTSAKVYDDGTVMLFSRFWVRVPVDVFYDQQGPADQPERTP